VQSAKRKCLHLYYYFMDRDLGLLHVRVQTWFPLQVQIYLNGHEWLARRLTARGIEHAKIDNVFIRVGDLPRAQRLADRFAHLNWPRILNRYARRVVPQLDDVLSGCEYYWVAAQAEYSTDVMFKTAEGLRELYPRLLSHSTLCFGAEEVMNFLGPQARGQLPGRGGLRSVQLRVPPYRWLEDQAPGQAELAEDVRQGGTRVENRDRDQQPGGVPRAQAGLARRQAAHRMGRAAQGRGVSVPVSRDLAAGQRPLPRCPGCGRRPDSR